MLVKRLFAVINVLDCSVLQFFTTFEQARKFIESSPKRNELNIIEVPSEELKSLVQMSRLG